jgi:hypothetical protein
MEAGAVLPASGVCPSEIIEEESPDVRWLMLVAHAVGFSPPKGPTHLESGACFRDIDDIATASVHAVRWLLSQAWKPEKGSKVKAVAKKRRTKLPVESRLTPKQAEAVATVASCKGNVAEAAKRLKKDRKTVVESYEKGLEKLGRNNMKHVTKRMKTDRRGQADLSEDDCRD